MSKALISVIIPVYNTRKYLQRCIDSIIGQTYKNLQIILIDDGSTDGSDKICDDYKEKDSRVTCIHQKNEGVSKARNVGLLIAKGDYIHFPDSDDYLEKDTYEYLLQKAEKYKCDIVNFEYYITYETKELRHQVNENQYGNFNVEDSHKIVITDQPFAWNKFFSYKSILGIKFREDIYRGEDSLFVHCAIEQANTIWFDKRPLYHYVQSEESACRGKFRRSQLSVLKLHDTYQKIYQDKYPKIWNLFLSKLPDIYISIYYDMWSDNSNFKIEQKNFLDAYRNLYRELSEVNIAWRSRMKFGLFYSVPDIFCKLHKFIHKL